jgi:hypothetical protein
MVKKIHRLNKREEQSSLTMHLNTSGSITRSLSELEIHFEVNMHLRILPGITESRSRATTRIIIHFELMSFLKTSNYLIKQSRSVELALTMQMEWVSEPSSPLQRGHVLWWCTSYVTTLAWAIQHKPLALRYGSRSVHLEPSTSISQRIVAAWAVH